MTRVDIKWIKIVHELPHRLWLTETSKACCSSQIMFPQTVKICITQFHLGFSSHYTNVKYEF